MEVALLFFMVIGLMLIGVPIAVSLGLSSTLFLLWFSDTSLASIAQTLFEAFEGHFTLLAIPFFILASTFMSTGGVAKRIIRFSIACVGHFPGGLAIAGVFACMMFAALSGSSPATVVAIGSIVIAGMRQVGYTKDFAAGVICNAGTLGILIPPSIVMVVYAAAVEVSVGRMFLAGVIPGLLAGAMLMITIYAMAKIQNLPKGEWKGWSEIAASLVDAGFGLFLVVIILGGIYGGIFTPTEAAAVASVYAFFVAIAVYRDMGPLKSIPWISDQAAPQIGLGFRAVVFAAIGALLHVFATHWGIAVAWVAISLGVAALMLLMPKARGLLSLIVIGVLGGLPAIAVLVWLMPGIYAGLGTALAEPLGGFASMASVIVSAIAFVGIAALALLPPVVFVYALRDAADRAQSYSVAGQLAGGALALGKGLGFSLYGLTAGLFHKDTQATLFDAGKLTVTLLFVIANALILKHVLTDEQIPQQIASAMLSAGFGPIMFLVIVNVILLIGGQFMEPSGLLVIVAPLVFPIAIELGIDPIHLGIIMVVNMEIGMITPPVGLNLFVTSGVAKMPMMGVVRAALPFLAVLFVFLILVTYIPAISTILPNAVMGPELVVF